MFETRFKIRATQLDTFGHLNHAAFLEIFEWARWEWAVAGGPDPMRMVQEQGIGPAIVHVDIHFSKEVRFHETVLVKTWFKELGKRRGVIGQEMLKPDGSLASRATITFVMLNLKTRKMDRIPEEMRAMYQADEPYRRLRASARRGISVGNTHG